MKDRYDVLQGDGGVGVGVKHSPGGRGFQLPVLLSVLSTSELNPCRQRLASALWGRAPSQSSPEDGDHIVEQDAVVSGHKLEVHQVCQRPAGGVAEVAVNAGARNIRANAQNLSSHGQDAIEGAIL